MPVYFFGQTAQYLKIAREKDSVFYDFSNGTLYSKGSGNDTRFNTIKQCTLVYTSKKKADKEKEFRFYAGAWFSCPSPFPHWRTTQTIIEYEN